LLTFVDVPIASTKASMASVEALMVAVKTSIAFVKALTAYVEALTASGKVLTAYTDVAGSSGSSGCFFDFLPLSTSSGLDSLSSRGDFLGTISSVLISCFTRTWRRSFEILGRNYLTEKSFHVQ
jgi:hypothetical protein